MKKLSHIHFVFCTLAVLFGAKCSLANDPRPTNEGQAQRCRTILERSIVGFYLPHCVDTQCGGYHQELGTDNKFTPGEKFLTLQARQLWFFSTLAARNMKRPDSLAAAKSGFDFIQQHFLDTKRGGYYSKVDREGKVIDSRKHAYLNAFALYALVEYYRASSDPNALEQANRLFLVLEEHAHDSKNLGYQEFFTADWEVITDPKESGYVGAIGVKTYNTHLHLMEAFTSLYQETKDPLVGKRLAELIEINTKTVKHPQFACNIDAWTPDWKMIQTPQNLRASYGHDVECVWLVLDAIRALGQDPQTMRGWAENICQYSLEFGYDKKHHGFFYSGPLDQPANDKKKEWWPQAEALVAMLTMHQLTGEQNYRRKFDETLTFIERHQVSPQGSWWASLNADGSLGQNLSRTSMWQGAYHNGRSMLLCEQLLLKAKQ